MSNGGEREVGVEAQRKNEVLRQKERGLPSELKARRALASFVV
jgi:hypothetical protein